MDEGSIFNRKTPPIDEQAYDVDQNEDQGPPNHRQNVEQSHLAQSKWSFVLYHTCHDDDENGSDS